MPKRTRKQKIAAQQRRLNSLQQQVINKPLSQPVIIKSDTKETVNHQQSVIIKKDLIKTIIITLFLVLLELIIFKI